MFCKSLLSLGLSRNRFSAATFAVPNWQAWARCFEWGLDAAKRVSEFATGRAAAANPVLGEAAASYHLSLQCWLPSITRDIPRLEGFGGCRLGWAYALAAAATASAVMLKCL